MKSTILKVVIILTCFLPAYLQAQYDDYDSPTIDFNATFQNVRTIVEKESDFSNVEARAYMEIDKSLKGFLETPLMDKFKDLKIEAESLIITFKTRQGEFSPEDIITIKNAYKNFSEEYNKVLLQVKADFMNRKQRKAISGNPNWYAATLELQFRNLEDNYSQYLLQEVANLTGSDQYSAFPLMAILGMIELTRDFVNHIARIKYEGKKVREQHINQFFIEPYSMKPWRDLEAIHTYNNESYDRENQANPYSTPYGNRNPFEEVPDTTKQKKHK